MSRDKDSQRLYKDLAWTWPIISPPEDYENEAEQFHTAVIQHSRIPAKTMLDLGCGGGHNDFHLKRNYEEYSPLRTVKNGPKTNPILKMRDMNLIPYLIKS